MAKKFGKLREILADGLRLAGRATALHEGIADLQEARELLSADKKPRHPAMPGPEEAKRASLTGRRSAA